MSVNNPPKTDSIAGGKPDLLTGFTEYVVETGIAYLGIGQLRNDNRYPVPVSNGDHITLYTDDAHQHLLLAGHLVKDPDALAKDPSQHYTADHLAYIKSWVWILPSMVEAAQEENATLESIDEKISSHVDQLVSPYIENPYYLHLTVFDQNAIDMHMKKSPKSTLQSDLETNAEVLKPATVHELFAKEYAAIVTRRDQSNPSSANTDTHNRLAP